jgi:hypothetical protein
MSMSRSGVRTGIAVGLALSGGLLAVHLLTSRHDPFAVRRFDTTSWAAADHEGRAAMARDAIRHLPTGLPEAEIVTLLGKPDEVIETQRLTRSGPPNSARTYSYYLGSWGWPGYDSTFLWVHVDGEGRIVSGVIGGG